MNASSRFLSFMFLFVLALFGANVALVLFGPVIYRTLSTAMHAMLGWALTAGPL